MGSRLSETRLQLINQKITDSEGGKWGLVGGQAIKEGFLREATFTLGPEGEWRDPEPRE